MPNRPLWVISGQAVADPSSLLAALMLTLRATPLKWSQIAFKRCQMFRGIRKIEHAIEAEMWERDRVRKDLPKRIKGKGWFYPISDWLNGPPDVHDFTLVRQVYGTDVLTESQIAAFRSAMRSLAIKPIKAKSRNPKPPASAFHQ